MLPLVKGCRDKPHSVTVTQNSKSDDVAKSADSKRIVAGWIKETWTFDVCDQVTMYVTYHFQPDGRVQYEIGGR
jgi:hypothetical protein